MLDTFEILNELAEIIVKASIENRELTHQESEYFNKMLDKSLELASLNNEN